MYFEFRKESPRERGLRVKLLDQIDWIKLGQHVKLVCFVYLALLKLMKILGHKRNLNYQYTFRFLVEHKKALVWNIPKELG